MHKTVWHYDARMRLRRVVMLSCAILALFPWLTPPAVRADSIILQTCAAADLINAINTANTDADADAIVLLSTCTGADSYTLTTVNNTSGNGPNGLPVITGNLTIEGNGAAIVRSTANGTPAFRLMEISSLAIVNLNNVTLQNGTAGGGSGGGIYDAGTLNLNGSTLSNHTANQGGAMYVAYPGLLTMTTSTVTQNTATLLGGGIAVFTGGAATISRTTFVQNRLDNGAVGAAFFVYNAQVTIGNSTFYNNDAGSGGGGAIANEAGNLTLTNNTIANNAGSAQFGGGITNQGNAYLQNNIVANNTPLNCSTINQIDQGNNLDSGATCGFNQTSSLNNANPQLGNFGNYGGPTETMALAANSPALNAGNDFACNGRPILRIDQRGVARPQGTHCDMGAFELQLASLEAPCEDAPRTPQLLTPQDRAVVTAKRVSLDWAMVACATRYELRLTSDRQGRANQLLEQELTTSHYTPHKLKRQHRYTWQVRACRHATCSAWSQEQHFTYNP